MRVAGEEITDVQAKGYNYRLTSFENNDDAVHRQELSRHLRLRLSLPIGWRDANDGFQPLPYIDPQRLSIHLSRVIFREYL